MARLFISCVSNEFAHYRDALRRDFTRPNLDTKIQEDFIAYGGATMAKLDDYIRQCDAVIHICGDMTGSMANDISLQYIRDTYQGFGQRYPALLPILNGTEQMSYTQWEAWLAIYHGKQLFVAAPTADAKRDDRYIRDDAQIAHQQVHLNRLRQKGYYDEIQFGTEDNLVKQLYRSKLGDILNGIPKFKAINLPYQSIGTAFKGRAADLQALADHFATQKGAAKGIALHALGGMGKTRLAIEYALAHQNDYTALLFVHAAEAEWLTTNMAGLADPKILDLPEHTATDERIKHAAVIQWLNTYSGWLLILDNADTTAAAKAVEILFGSLQQGHVLITSRLSHWSLQIHKQELHLLSPEAATAFLLETTDTTRAKQPDDPTVAAQIANDLGHLALALEQARAYIATNEISFAAYRQKWEANRLGVLQWYDAQQMQYPASVAITWQTSFDQLSPQAVDLLNRLAWMAPDPIPRTLLDVDIPDVEAIDMQAAWAELKKYSLVSSAADKQSFTVHRLVQDITRSRMDEAQTSKTLLEALGWMDAAFVGDSEDVNSWPVLEPLVPHILSLLEYAEKYNMGHDFTRLMNDTALLFKTKAQYAIAEPLYRRSLEIDERRLGANHSEVTIRLNNLAALLLATNRLQEAEPLMRRALEIDEASFGPDHPNVARDLNNLAQLLKDTNRLQEAEPLMRRALAVVENSLGTNHPYVAISLSNLAQLLKDTNRLGEADPLIRRALAIDEARFGPNHPKVAIRLNNLGQLLQATKRFQEAEPLYRRALTIDEASFSPTHPNVAIDLNNLASLLNNTNRLQEAAPLMERSLLIFIQSLGTEHPNTIGVGKNYSILLQQMGKSEEEIAGIIGNLLS